MTALTTPSLRERIVAEAAAMTAEVGWSAVTMGALAARVGVSRQTVYNELGSKPALAEAMVLRELDRFLGAVGDAFDAHSDDLPGAVREAVRGVLVLAEDNPLLQAVATSAHGAVADLLPLLTTRSETLISVAREMIMARLERYAVGPAGHDLDVVVDVLARVVLSHVMRPSGHPARTADDIAWVAARLLRA